MDSVEIVKVASPFGNLAPIYEVDPDADALLIVPPSKRTFAPWHEIDGGQRITPGLRIKVSSKHLALASRAFRNRLQFGNSKAARQSDGRVHLTLAEGFDAKAVSIVMKAIHGRGSKVPKAADLETLAQIALFVDRFQLLDAVEVYAERWISKLEDSIPDTYNQDLVRWIYISHVFHDADIFKAVTKVAAVHSAGPIDSLGLPIREKIIQHIDTQRQTLVNQTLTHLHQTLDTLTSGTVACPTHHCDSLLLGELIKSLHKHRLVWPRPAKPFPGLGFASIVAGVAGGVSVHLQDQQQPHHHRQEVEPCSSGGGSGGGTPGWGVVGGVFPITPAASPEPVYRGGSGRFGDGYECEARRVVARLGGLGRLEEGVQGLVLESGLGYRVY
ncbi:hypothetical protein C8A00DRAFT_42559 [Chaetomidium leptoderma]|uniref:BTB domain-containing protein n=1 Tax=Chaetomidium leptoderma TaxID=669021 RepID=A0AAN6VPU9_9PEZI|nr:hypothetical protein C8A00DRAFT_42559 [Chaetomidium leptoderma]